MSEFIKYLAELISEDYDLDSVGNLIYESDAEERRLERLAAGGDPEAGERLMAMRRRRNPADFSDVFDAYCDIVGYRPEGFNQDNYMGSFNPNDPYPAGVGPNSPGPDGVWDSERYNQLRSQRLEQRQQMGEWLANNYIEFPAMAGLIKLLEGLWYRREYLDGKRLYYGPNGINQPEMLESYESHLGNTIDKIENRIRRILKETEAIHPAPHSTRAVRWSTYVDEG